MLTISSTLARCPPRCLLHAFLTKEITLEQLLLCLALKKAAQTSSRLRFSRRRIEEASLSSNSLQQFFVNNKKKVENILSLVKRKITRTFSRNPEKRFKTFKISRQSHLKSASSILVLYYLLIYQETRRPCTTVHRLWFSYFAICLTTHCYDVQGEKNVQCAKNRFWSVCWKFTLWFLCICIIRLETRRPCIEWTDLYQLPK